jgi:hypothetical protein
MSAQRNLSYESTPPFFVPLAFFLTAAVFGFGAGGYLLANPEALVSRWTPAALALTHLITVGFMLLVMLGALMQILPVVAGASLPRIRPVAAGVLTLTSAGTLALAAGFASGRPALLLAAAILLGLGLLLFLGAALLGIRHAGAQQATGRDLRIALVALAITAVLGIALILVLSRGVALPLLALTHLHVGWGWLGWGGILLAATSWVVVPMFQITPNYPAWLTRIWAPTVFALLLVWTAATLGGMDGAGKLVVPTLAFLAGLFGAITLRQMQQTRRPRPDASFRTLQLAMGSLIAGAIVALLSTVLEDEHWPVMAGVLVLHGGFVSAISAMLYKIVPFLAWLHLTQARIKAPNMKKLLPDAPVRQQLLLHAFTLPAVLAAASGHAYAGRVAGIMLMIEFSWLLYNLIGTARRWREAMADATPATARA